VLWLEARRLRHGAEWIVIHLLRQSHQGLRGAFYFNFAALGIGRCGIAGDPCRV